MFHKIVQFAQFLFLSTSSLLTCINWQQIFKVHKKSTHRIFKKLFNLKLAKNGFLVFKKTSSGQEKFVTFCRNDPLFSFVKLKTVILMLGYKHGKK